MVSVNSFCTCHTLQGLFFRARFCTMITDICAVIWQNLCCDKFPVTNTLEKSFLHETFNEVFPKYASVGRKWFPILETEFLFNFHNIIQHE